MPPRRPRQLQTRAIYARTAGDMLTGGVNPSDSPPVMWWYGLDTGAGAYPIGPNGPGTAGALPVVTRATSLITGPVTAAPFRVLELGFGGRPLGRPRWVTDPMLVRQDLRFPNPGIYPAVLRLGRAEFWTEWLRSAIWWGLGGFLFVEDELGQPLAGSLRNVSPHALTTRRDDDGALCWVIGDPDGDNVEADRDGYLQVGTVRYRLCVLRNPHSPVDTEGLSAGVFAMSPATFSLAGQVDSYTSSTFRSGVPNGYLKVETPGLTPDGAATLKSKWMEAHGGDRRSIAVLNSTTSFTPISLSPIDSALAEVKRLSIADTAYAFGLDPMTLGVSLANSATYNNIRDAWLNHRDFGLAPWIAAVEDCLTALLPGVQGVKVDLDRFANPAPKERFDGYAVAINAGVLTANECRELEGLPPLPEPVVPPQLVQAPEEQQELDTQPEDETVDIRSRRQPWR